LGHNWYKVACGHPLAAWPWSPESILYYEQDEELCIFGGGAQAF